ncbi:MAG TPA: phage protease [Bryobacteraceae bacterium]|nr:phage protease [Bryobacteraceae bacterium]
MHSNADSLPKGLSRPQSAIWADCHKTARKPFCNALQAFFNGIRRPTIFANEARSEICTSGASEDLAVANESDGWYRLSGYGDFPHYKGLQRIDLTAANSMTDLFRSGVARVKRLLTGNAGLPVYRGHPDDPDFAEKYSDQDIYGRIDDMQARPDGFYGHIAWSNEWEKLKAEGRWRFSPRWAMGQIAPGVFSPKRLVSVGLTHEPNLPDAAFANSNNENETTMTLLEMILAKLGFAADRIAATKTGGEGAIKPEEVDAALDKMGESDKAKADVTALNSRVTTLEAEKAAALATAANERRARATIVIDEAIAKGKIAAAQRDEETRKLADATDFTVAANELSARKPVMHTSPQFPDQGSRRAPEIITASNEMNALVEAHMEQTKMDWVDSWVAVSQTEKGKSLIAAMQPVA